MDIQSTTARQVALHDRRSEHVHFGKDADDVQTKTSHGLGLFRSKATQAKNKAEYASFLAVLRADPNYAKAGGVADKAIAAIAKQADSGKPLSSRVMAQAYAAGDTALQKFHEARALERDTFTQNAIRLVNTAQTLDAAIEKATQGSIKNFTATAPAEVIDAVKADILDGVRDEARAIHARGDISSGDIDDLAFLIDASAAKRADRIAATLAAGQGGFVQVDSLAAKRLEPIVERIVDFSERRLEARLTSSAGANEVFERQIMNELGAELRKLDNTELARLYRTTLSADMMEFRLALANLPDDPRAGAVLADLNGYVGMVNQELAERALTGMGEKPGDLTGGQLDLLTGVDTAAAKRELVYQSDAWLEGDPSAARSHDPAAAQKLQGKGMAPVDVVKLLRQADLTINLPLDLLDPGGAFIKEDGSVDTGALKLKNIFELPAGRKGEAYRERRQVIEHAQIPGLAKRDQAGLDPTNHPVSAGVNVGRLAAGAAPLYGKMFLVLDEAVKERATFTPTDSFYAFEAHMTDETVGNIKHALLDLLAPDSPLSAPQRERFNADPTLLPKMLQRLDQAVGRDFGLGHPKSLEDFFFQELSHGIPLSLDDREVVWNAVLTHAIDRSREGSKIASYERLDQLIGGLQDVDLDTLETGHDDTQRVNLRLDKYIEAQVFGGIDLTKDVRALHYQDPGSFADDEDIAQLKAAETLAKALGVPFVLVDSAAMAKTRLGTDESLKATFPTVKPGSAAAGLGSLDAFKKQELPTILDAYKSHEQGFDPEGIHGRRHISRAVVYANVLANVLREKGATVDSYALYTATASHDAGREGNGVDRWEKESGEEAVARMKANGIDDDAYLQLARATIDSRAPSGNKTIEGGILKSADSLDIMRLYGKDGYRTDLLWFMFEDLRIGKDQYIEADHALRDKLIDEIAQFIEATEPVPQSQPAYKAAVARIEQIGTARLTAEGDALDQLDQDLDTAEALAKQLKQQMMAEHQAANAQLSSTDIFAAIEKELLQNPAKYPTLAKYYDPTS